MNLSPSTVARSLSLASVLIAAACSSQGGVGGRTNQADTTQCAYGLDNTNPSSVADQSCQIVLRQAAISTMNGAPYEIYNQCNQEWLVYRGFIDVSNSVDPSATVYLRYTGHDGEFAGQWFSVAATPSTSSTAPAGFTRYEFATQMGTWSEGDDIEPEVDMIPYLALPDGSRVYDHNRVADPLGAYTLSQQFNFQVTNDPSVCPAIAATATPPAPAPVSADAGAASNDAAASQDDGGPTSP